VFLNHGIYICTVICTRNIREVTYTEFTSSQQIPCMDEIQCVILEYAIASGMHLITRLSASSGNLHAQVSTSELEYTCCIYQSVKKLYSARMGYARSLNANIS
jgi:hypothetical protein